MYFYCNISHQYTVADGAVFEVNFLFDQEIDDRVPAFFIRGDETSVGLHEKYLHGNLGKRVCNKSTGCNMCHVYLFLCPTFNSFGDIAFTLLIRSYLLN